MPRLRLYRRLVKRVDQSLPRRAGRAYVELERREWKPVVLAVIRKGRGITVRSAVKPKPDLERYAKAILTRLIEPLYPGSESWISHVLPVVPPLRSAQ